MDIGTQHANLLNMLKHFLIQLITGYQRFVSPFLGRRCRFDPTCSAYAKEALIALPLGQAIKRIAIRLSKCHPFNQSPPCDPL